MKLRFLQGSSGFSVISVGVKRMAQTVQFPAFPTPISGRQLRNSPTAITSPITSPINQQPHKKRKIRILNNGKSPDSSSTKTNEHFSSSTSDMTAICPDDEMEVDSTQDPPPPTHSMMTGSDLKEIIERADRIKSTLILDCRLSKNYKTGHVKHSQNVPIPQGCENERFTSRSAVLQFFYDQLPGQIPIINVPGVYSDIIIYDDFSSTEMICQSLNILLAAICSWNAGKRTQVWYVDGGYQSIAKDFPQLLVSTDSLVPITRPQTFPSIINEFEENPVIPSESSSKAEEMMASFEPYLKNLDDSINKTVEKLELKRKLRALEEMSALLMKENMASLRKAVSEAVDDDLKCLACKEVFSGTIFQCASGHCICPDCSEERLVCSVGTCKMPFKYGCYDPSKGSNGIKIRSGVLEGLMENTLAIECPNVNGCGELVMLCNVSRHVKECGLKKGAVGKKLDEDIQGAKLVLEMVTFDLETLSKKLLDTELSWLAVTGMDDVPLVSREFAEQLYAKSSTLHELQMTLKLETFLKKRKINDGVSE